MTKNQQQIDLTIKEYDDQYGLTDVSEETAPKIEKHLDELSDVVGKVKVEDKTKKDLSKYKFKDKDGNPIPQFRNKKGELVADYTDGCTIDEKGRLQSVIDLAKHDVVLHHVARVDEKIDDKELANEVNEEILYKLYEIDTAEKIINGTENPEQFTDPKYREEFINNLRANGGSISDRGYQAAMDYQVNQTAGFCTRLKSKVKGATNKIGGVFSKLFKPISNIDKRSKARFSNSANPEDKRKKRIDFFVRILKGFASAFLVSAAITTIATAGAALAGVSVAAGLAIVGVIVGIAKSAIQINKWRKSQKAKGLPSDIKAFVKDKRMIASLGTTALGAAAMVFGAAGLAQVAIPLGYGALALGGTTSAVQMYRDAKSANMSTAESLMWSLANVAAVVGGGFAGRAAANYGISEYNKANPDNEVFQRKVSDGHEAWDEEHSHQEYTPEALEHAKEIAAKWYQDNPELLQQRVDAINAYNAEHGTTIDPYRAIVLNGDAGGITADNMALHVNGGGVVHSHGQHTVFGAGWAHEHGIDMSEVNSLKHLFNADGTINPDGMVVAQKIDPMVSAINEVRTVSNGDTIAHIDRVLNQNTTLSDGKTPAYNTYANGPSPYHTVTDVVHHDGTAAGFEPISNPGMGMFGQYAPKTILEKIRDRLGSLADSIFGPRKESRPQDIEHADDVPEEEERDALPPADEEHKQLPGAKEEERDALPPADEEYKQSPGAKEEERGALPPADEEHKQSPGAKEEERDALPPADEEYKQSPGAKEEERDALPPADEEYKQSPGAKEEERDALPPADEEHKQLPGAKEEDNGILQISRGDAKSWNDLHEQLDRVQKSVTTKNSPAKEAEDLKREEKRIKQEINRLYNKFGRPSQRELNDAVDYAIKKDILDSKQGQLAKIEQELARSDTDKIRRSDLLKKQQLLQERIKQLQEELVQIQNNATNPEWIYETHSVNDSANGFKKAAQQMRRKEQEDKKKRLMLGLGDAKSIA